MDKDKKNTCCFFGHRKIAQTEELRIELYRIIQELVEQKNVHTFLFGSKSRFDSLCYEVVSSLKEKYPHIRRVYVRDVLSYYGGSRQCRRYSALQPFARQWILISCVLGTRITRRRCRPRIACRCY